MFHIDNYKLDEYNIAPPAIGSAQVVTGQFDNTNLTAPVTIDCGFSPDLVHIYTTAPYSYKLCENTTFTNSNYKATYNSDGDSGSYKGTCYNVEGSGHFPDVINDSNTNYIMTASGFTFSPKSVAIITYHWIAIKF